MEHEKTRIGEPCKGVIKKLFPAKRYGFAICECSTHKGEAHFNYSELDLDEEGRNALCVGWRLYFDVSPQDRPTHHCAHRASRVRPFDEMVVQCELIDVRGDIGVLNSRELAGRKMFIRRDKYNGKFEVNEGSRRETCRALITFEQLRQQEAVALHCSQDTPSSTTASTSRRNSATPERKCYRRDIFTAQLDPVEGIIEDKDDDHSPVIRRRHQDSQSSKDSLQIVPSPSTPRLYRSVSQTPLSGRIVPFSADLYSPFTGLSRQSTQRQCTSTFGSRSPSKSPGVEITTPTFGLCSSAERKNSYNGSSVISPYLDIPSSLMSQYTEWSHGSDNVAKVNNVESNNRNFTDSSQISAGLGGYDIGDETSQELSKHNQNALQSNHSFSDMIRNSMNSPMLSSCRLQDAEMQQLNSLTRCQYDTESPSAAFMSLNDMPIIRKP